MTMFLDFIWDQVHGIFFDIITGLSVTRVLTITKARITQLDADNLSSLSNLEELDLDGNDLTAFNATAFEVNIIPVIYL